MFPRAPPERYPPAVVLSAVVGVGSGGTRLSLGAGRPGSSVACAVGAGEVGAGELGAGELLGDRAGGGATRVRPPTSPLGEALGDGAGVGVGGFVVVFPGRGAGWSSGPTPPAEGPTSTAGAGGSATWPRGA